MVYVLPLPVCPYAKQVTLHLSKIVPTSGATVVRYTVSFETSGEYTSSNVNVCVSVYSVRSTLVLGSQTVKLEDVLCGAGFAPSVSELPGPASDASTVVSTVTTSVSSRDSSFAFNGRFRTTTRIRGWSAGNGTRLWCVCRTCNDGWFFVRLAASSIVNGVFDGSSATSFSFAGTFSDFSETVTARVVCSTTGPEVVDVVSTPTPSDDEVRCSLERCRSCSSGDSFFATSSFPNAVGLGTNGFLCPPPKPPFAIGDRRNSSCSSAWTSRSPCDVRTGSAGKNVSLSSDASIHRAVDFALFTSFAMTCLFTNPCATPSSPFGSNTPSKLRFFISRKRVCLCATSVTPNWTKSTIPRAPNSCSFTEAKTSWYEPRPALCSQARTRLPGLCGALPSLRRSTEGAGMFQRVCRYTAGATRSIGSLNE
mmetsp:Transcript_6939/g.26218  ORF Transcript_6939/g.26218 Transcript_6939/m.26218 type:complete len:423 (+) Transcript_6939:2562-3830(+)